MAVLGLDVGTKRIGVAVSDPSDTFAIPVGTIERRNLDADLEYILRYVEEYHADVVVVGDPITLAGERGIAAEKIDHFVERLEKRLGRRILRVDERLTTAQAIKTLIAADVSRKKRKGAVDKMAAALILESYLARRRMREPE